MNCIDMERLIDPYLDGELTGSLRVEFDAHRLRCPQCQQKLSLIEACEHILAGDQRVPALADDFTDRLMACIDGHAPQPIPLHARRRLMIGAGLGLAAAAAVAVFFALPDRDTSSRAQPLAPELVRAMGDKSGVDVKSYMDSRIDQLYSVPNRLVRDMRGLPDLALGLAAPAEAGESDMLGLFRLLFPTIEGPHHGVGEPERDEEPPVVAPGLDRI